MIAEVITQFQFPLSLPLSLSPSLSSLLCRSEAGHVGDSGSQDTILYSEGGQREEEKPGKQRN